MSAPEGFVDEILPTRISGWAWDPDRPDLRPEVRIEIDGVVVARTIADIYRPDLLASGKGDGKYGFTAKLDNSIDVGRADIRGLVGDHDQELRFGRYALPQNADAPRPSEPEDLSQAAHPVFIIGSPRSGTTILASALRNGGYHGFDEGHLLSLIRGVREIVDAHFATHKIGSEGQLLSQIDSEAVKLGMISALKAQQDAANPSAPWIDKTPGTDMYFAVPYIAKLWPEAKFIFAKRRAIENVVSRMKKFPDAPFALHCEDWVATMEGWRNLRDSGISHIEIDQYDIARQPQNVAQKLGAFLRLPCHSVELVATEMTSSRPEATSANSASQVYSLESTGWSDDQIAEFREKCTAEMVAFGYSFDESYRRGEAEQQN